MTGENSTWWDLIRMPINILTTQALLNHFEFHGEEFSAEYPVDSGNHFNLFEVAEDPAKRLDSISLINQQGVRPFPESDQRPLLDPN